MQVYLSTNNNPQRSVILISKSVEDGQKENVGLLFKATENQQVIVELLNLNEEDEDILLKDYRLVERGRDVQGVLGLASVNNDVFLTIVSTSLPLKTVISGEVPKRILGVNFYSLTTNLYDALPIENYQTPFDNDDDDMTYNSNNLNSLYSSPSSSVGTSMSMYEPHPCMPLKKLVEGGNFYHANGLWDITTRLCERVRRHKKDSEDWESIDERFVWNLRLIEPLLHWRKGLTDEERAIVDRHRLLILAIQGSISTYPISSSLHGLATLSVISRLSWKRAGTRFNTRGVDDDGEVANFVEIRGSIPLFWEQQGVQAFGQRVQITRPFQASQPAFEKHFIGLFEKYDAIHVLNLLGQKENEAILTAAYTTHLQALDSDRYPVSFDNVDFHAVVRLLGHDSVISELEKIRHMGEGEGPAWSVIDSETNEVIMRQNCVFRINCLDCLDRTNFVQDIFSKSRLREFLDSINSPYTNSEYFWQGHRHLWAENGDALSKIYAGTGALNSSFTRSGKRTLAGLFSDATKSISRAYVSNVTDKSKQLAIDLFLGNISSQTSINVFDPINDSIKSSLQSRLNEYSSSKRVHIHAGTYNLAGKIPTESVIPWIFPNENDPEPDIIALGFQELVQLTPQQMMSTDTEPRKVWEKFIIKSLQNRRNKGSDYIIIRSEQLVGLALIILVKENLTGSIRSVEGVNKKTGMKGMSGNKGAAAIRLQYEDTTFCFISAHMAAGHLNVEERNNDYWTISNGLQFLKGKTLDNHDNIIWLGDFNYRIDLSYEKSLELINKDDLYELYNYDQLQRVRSTRGIFKGYEEGPIIFKPTYRFDFNSDDYDTSEKRRIPAYTDRILFKGPNLDCFRYCSVDIMKGSDHRPVYATFITDVRKIDVKKRELIAKKLHDDLVTTAPGETLDEKLNRLGLNKKPSVSSINKSIKSLPSSNASSISISKLGKETPPPSDEKQNWWTDENGNDLDFVSHIFDSMSNDEHEKLEKHSLISTRKAAPSPPVVNTNKDDNNIRRKPPPPVNLAKKQIALEKYNKKLADESSPK